MFSYQLIFIALANTILHTISNIETLPRFLSLFFFILRGFVLVDFRELVD